MLVQTKTVDLYKVYGGRLLKLGKRRIPGHSSRRLSSGSANNISDRVIPLSCQCQNALQEDHYGDDLSPRNGWLLRRIGVLDIGALPRRLPSPLEALQSLWKASLSRHFSVARRVAVSYLRYWHKNFQAPFQFGRCPRNSATGEGQLFRIWGPGGEGKVDSLKARRPWLVTTTDGAESWHSRSRGCFLP